MIIDVNQSMLERAKAEMKEFDEQKTHNKFVCAHNYIGLLGEMMYDEYLTSLGADYQWVEFCKKGWNQPDFVLGEGYSVDVKTTYTNDLWFTSPKFDVYILMMLTRDNKKMNIKGYMTRQQLLKAIEDGTAKKVVQGNRTSYCLPSEHIKPHNLKMMMREMA